MIGGRKIVLLLTLMVLAVSCGRKGSNLPDLSKLQLGDYYVAQSNGRYVVLYVEDVAKKSFKGRWYVENGGLSQPHCFMATSCRGHRNELWSDSLVVKADAMHGDTLVMDMVIDDSLTLSFLPWYKLPVKDIHRSYLYHDPQFEVDVDTNAVYAHGQCYWTTYPEPADRNDFLSIVLEKMSVEDLTLKDSVLKMDVYYPIDEELRLRPLLLLIHGGAFFNGDKQAQGYSEWAKHFASRGYVVASINYRLGFIPIGPKYLDRAGYRAVQDAHAAICYLLHNYSINPEWLFVGGSSAGGITALNLAFMDDNNRPQSTREGPLHEGADFVNIEFGCDDLGNPDALAETPIPFKINTVVNMWGAVHDVDILGASPSTAILSFHGDADSIVAYGYDFPFTKLKTPVRDFFTRIEKVFEDNNSKLAQHIRKVCGALKKMTIPLNQILSHKMYGSKCIHEKAIELGMQSELHTKAGGGHSLHVNDDGSLSDYFTLITDTTTRFLYQRMFPRPTMKQSQVGCQQWFELENAGELLTCRWEAIGGLVLEAEHDRARVVFFWEAPEHKICIAGQKKNNEDYDEVYVIE